VTHRLLFVCAANVCRSPSMAFFFANALGEGRDDWSIESRGVRGTRPRRMCDSATAFIADRPAGVEFAHEHRAAPLTAEDVLAADLIIAASREERGGVARLAPDARDRTFTLREALALSEVGAVRGSSAPQATGEPSPTLADFARLLDARRGRLAEPATARRLRGPLRLADPQDFPDFHSESRRRHRAMLGELRAAVDELETRVVGFLGMTPALPSGRRGSAEA